MGSTEVKLLAGVALVADRAKTPPPPVCRLESPPSLRFCYIVSAAPVGGLRNTVAGQLGFGEPVVFFPRVFFGNAKGSFGQAGEPAFGLAAEVIIAISLTYTYGLEKPTRIFFWGADTGQELEETAM